MNNYQDYVDYFERIALSLVDLNHDPDNGNKGFYRINLEELANGTRSDINPDGCFFVLSNYVWKPVVKEDGTLIKKGEGMFFVLGVVSLDDYDKQTEILSKTEAIAGKIMNRIRLDSLKDVESHEGNSIWNSSQDKMEFENVMPLQSPTNNNHYGCQVVFKFETPWDCSVSLEDWTDLTTESDIDPNA
jgi:hypothetical protein